MNAFNFTVYGIALVSFAFASSKLTLNLSLTVKSSVRQSCVVGLLCIVAITCRLPEAGSRVAGTWALEAPNMPLVCNMDSALPLSAHVGHGARLHSCLCGRNTVLRFPWDFACILVAGRFCHVGHYSKLLRTPGGNKQVRTFFDGLLAGLQAYEESHFIQIAASDIVMVLLSKFSKFI